MAQHVSRRSHRTNRAGSWTRSPIVAMVLVAVIVISIIYMLVNAISGTPSTPVHDVAYMTENGDLVIRRNTDYVRVPFKNEAGVDCWDVYECHHPKCPGEPKREVVNFDVAPDGSSFTETQHEYYLFPRVLKELAKMRDEMKGPWNPVPIEPSPDGMYPPEYYEQDQLLATITQKPVFCPACEKAKIVNPKTVMMGEEQFVAPYTTLSHKKIVRDMMMDYYKRSPKKR